MLLCNAIALRERIARCRYAEIHASKCSIASLAFGWSQCSAELHPLHPLCGTRRWCSESQALQGTCYACRRVVGDLGCMGETLRGTAALPRELEPSSRRCGPGGGHQLVRCLVLPTMLSPPPLRGLREPALRPRRPAWSAGCSHLGGLSNKGKESSRDRFLDRAVSEGSHHQINFHNVQKLLSFEGQNKILQCLGGHLFSLEGNCQDGLGSGQ